MIRYSEFKTSTDGAYQLADYAPGFARCACSRFVDVDCDTAAEALEEATAVLKLNGHIIVGSISVRMEYQNEDESYHYDVCAETIMECMAPMWERYAKHLDAAWEDWKHWNQQYGGINPATPRVHVIYS